MNHSALRHPSLSASAYIGSMDLCIPAYTEKHCRIEIRIKAKYLTGHLHYLGCMMHATKCNDETTTCSFLLDIFTVSKARKPSVHKTGERANNLFSLTKPRALPNQVVLVSFAWKNYCNFSLQDLISQSLYRSSVVVFSHPYKSSEWHLWNNRRSIQKRTKLSVSWRSENVVFHITSPEEQFPKFQKPWSWGWPQWPCSKQKYCTARKLWARCAGLLIAHKEAICSPHTPRIELTALTETQLAGIKLQEYVNTPCKASRGRQNRTVIFIMSQWSATYWHL